MAEDIIQNALNMHKSGDLGGAINLLKSGHQQTPQDPQILLTLAELLIAQESYIEASSALQQAIRLAPENPDIMVLYSKALSQTGNHDKALEMAEAALNQRPNSIQALNNASEVLYRAGNVSGLIKCLERLSALRPDDMQYCSDLARFYEKTQQYDKAYGAYSKLWDDSAATAFDYSKMGEYAFYAHHIEEALENLHKALELMPDNAHSWLFIGRCHTVLGDKKAAIEAFRKALSINPNFFNVYFFLSEIEIFDKNDPAFAHLEGIKSYKGLQIGDASALGYALGRMYHGIKDYDKAFENFKLGNTYSTRFFDALGYETNRAELAQSYRMVAALFSPENRKKLKFKGSDSTKPVFIVGMPRSGTTLLEQIMSAHTDIDSGGELRAITYSYQDLVVQTAALQGPAREAALLEAIDSRAEEFVAAHLKTLEDEGGPAPMVIDKLPQNFMHLGLINVLFPKAKIIHIKRDPMDVGLSVYCNQFSGDWKFFRDLGDIGYFISEYRKLMENWRPILDLPIHDVDYQALVKNPEAIAKGVIEFCDLDWQPECLDFYKKQSKVHTASLVQVRNPVNTSATGKWKAYEKHLGPLKAALEA